MVASNSFRASSPLPVLTTHSAFDQSSSRAEALSSTQESDVEHDTEKQYSEGPRKSLSHIGPSQGAMLTTTNPVESIPALLSTQVPDVGCVMEIYVNLLSLLLAQAGSSGLQKQPTLHKWLILEDLEPELAAKLRPYTRLRYTRQEKLTGFQAAYFNLQMDRLKITGMFTFSFPGVISNL